MEAQKHGMLGRGPQFVKVQQSIYLAALLGVLTLSAACGKKEASGPAGAAQQGPMPVSVVKVKTADVPLTGQWVGTMDGFVNAQIQPQVNGNLIRQLYREGSQVKKDQVLFQIDPRPFQAAVDQAKGQLEQAKGQVAQTEAQVVQTQAQLDLAYINLHRDTPLAQAQAIAQSQLDNDKQTVAQQEAAVRSAKAAVSASHAAVTAAQATLEAAEINLGFTQVKSLINGIAGQATTQVGNLVGPQSVLTAVSQLDPIKVYFSISDSEYLALVDQARQKGGDLLNKSASVPLTLTLANGKTYGQKGKIAFVDRQVTQQTGAIRIVATFPNPGNILRPGQFGRVSADTEVRHGAMLVPQIAVTELQGQQQVYTVGADNKVHIVNVTVGRQYGSDWLIENGVKPDTVVITDNLQKLKDGVPVAPQQGTPVASASPSNHEAAGN